MKFVAAIVVLSLFLFIPNSAALNKNGRDVRMTELYEILKKGDAREKQVALSMIWVTHDPEYHKDKFFSPILKLLNDKNLKVREAAVAKFKELAQGYRSNFYKSDIAKNAIVPALITSLSDNSASMRQETAKALGYYRDLRATKPLIQLLQDHHFRVCFEAIHALGRINAGTKAVVPLMNIIAVDDVWPAKLLQQEALKTLASMLHQGIVTVRQETPKKKYLKNGITIRKALIDPRIRGKVISILFEKRNDPYLKTDIIELLDAMHIQIGEYEAEKVIKYLVASTGDHNVQIRKLALSSLFPIAYSCARADNKTNRNGTIQKYRSIVTALCISALRDPSLEVRRKAADLLGQSEDPKAVRPLIAVLKDKSQDMKVAVIKALEHFNDSRIIDPLLGVLSDGNETAQISAIDVLGHYNDLKVVKALPPYFGSFKKTDDNVTVGRVFGKIAESTKEGIRLVYHYDGKRYVSKIDDTGSAIIPGTVDINSIKELMKHPIAVEGILRALKNPNFKGHLQALRMLRRFEDERIADNIMHFLDNPNPEIRKAALSLVYLSNDSDKAVTVIKRALNDKNANVQKEAQRILNALNAAYVKEDAPIEENIYALKSRDVSARLKAIKVLMHVNNNKKIIPLISCLDDADHRVRREAARALTQLNDKQAVRPLIEHLNDPSIQVRRAVIDALKHLKDTRAVKSLLALTDDERVEMHAVSALSWFDDPRVADFFLELLQHQNQKLQLEAVKYFSRHPDRRTVKLLIPLLKRSYRVMPSRAAGALGNSGDKRAVEPLIELLTTKFPKDGKEKRQVYRYKRSALLALAKFDDKRLYALFVDALEDDHLKQDAILALGGLQDKRAVPILLSYLSDPSPYIKGISIRSLGKIGDISVFDSILPFLSDPDELIAISAFHAMFHLDRQRTEKIVTGMLDTKNPVRFDSVLRIIGCSKDKSIILNLVKLAASRKENKNTIAALLSRCNNPVVVDILTSNLKKGNELDIRVASIDILGEFDDPKVKQLLMKYSNDPDPLIRRHVETALEEFKDFLIVSLTKDEDSTGLRYSRIRIKNKQRYNTMFLPRPIGKVRSLSGKTRAISGNIALGSDPRVKKILRDFKFDRRICVDLEIENPIKTEKLIGRLNDPDPIVKQEAAEFLGYFENNKATPVIIPLLKDQNPTVRRAAARALGLMKSTSAFSHLADSLYDPDVNVTAIAVWALGEINDEKAVTPLSTLMKRNQELRIKEDCAMALAKIDHKAANDVLITLLTESKDYRIRLLAADAVGRLGDAKLIPILKAAHHDANEYVRQAATKALRQIKDKTQ